MEYVECVIDYPVLGNCPVGYVAPVCGTKCAAHLAPLIPECNQQPRCGIQHK